MDTLILARDFASLLLDSAAKGTALLLLAAVAVWLCRRSSAALRHSIWCMTMGGLLLLPIASWAIPAWQIPILPPEPIPAPAPVAEFVRLPASSPVVETATLPPVEPAPQFATEQPEMPSEQRLIEPVVITSPVIEPAPIPAPARREPAAPPLTTSEWMSLLVTAGWLLGVTLFGVLLLAGLWRTVKLRRTSLMVTEGVWPRLMTELRQRLGLSRSVELREHALSVVPLTWGIWRPVVLLPRLARAWDEPMQRAVLLHELAHVQRGDVACQVLGRLTCVLYWFHPLTWFALRQLRQEREQACDDAVVQSGEKASDYAEQLLEVARLCCAPRGLSLGVAMAEGSSLEARVKSLFDTARGHGPVSRRVAIASLLIGGAILAGLAPIEPTASQAETTASQISPLNETPEADPTSASNHTNPKASKIEYSFSLDLCRKAFSDPTCLQQLEQLKPVYGKAARGIQLGLAVNTLSRSFTVGERLPLMLVYRNVGQEELTFHISQDHWNDPPTVIDQNGKHIQVKFVMHWMFVAPLKITLKPGEAWCEMTPGLYLDEPMPSIKSVAGKYRLTHLQGISDWQYEQRPETEGSAEGQIVNSPKWFEQLDTGTIEFEIAPSKNGALEARILAGLPADNSGVARTPTQEPAVPQKESTAAGQNDKAPKVDDVNPHEKMIVLPDGNGDSRTIIVGEVETTLDVDKIVWWGEAVDGLVPGFWLTETEDPRNLRVPMDSLVKYQVVVRNTTDKEMEFLARLLPFDGQDVPYLIPSSQLDSKGKIVAPQPAKEYQAQGASKVLDGENPAYIIRLAAGESVLVPGEFGLYVGKAPDEQYPQIANFVPGTHWIVQPLLVHSLADKERAELNRLLGEFQVTKIDRDGKTRQESVVRVRTPDNSMGKWAYAKYHLEVGTLDAWADRNARTAIWGEVEQGMQCGIRILNPQSSFKIGDTLEAEVLWRNTSEAVISTSLPRQLDLYPSMEDVEGKHLEIDFGARYDLLPRGHDFQPGEVRSLGVTRVRLVAQGTPGPKDNKVPGHITLEPGKYKLSASGGVGNINPKSGKYEFTVVSDETASSEQKSVLSGSAENPVVLITGRAINQQRQPLAGATIVLSDVIMKDGMRSARTLARAKADNSGAFQMEVSSALLHGGDPAAVLQMWAWTDTVKRDGFGMLPLIADSNQPMEIVILSPRAEEIRVVGPDGAPLTGILEQVNYGWGEDGILPNELLQQVVLQKEFQGVLTLHGFPWNEDRLASKLPNVRRGIWIQVAGRERHHFAWRPEPAISGPTTLTVPNPVTFQGQLTTLDGLPLPDDLDQVRVSLEINYQDKSLTEGWYFHNAGSVLCDAAGRFEIAGIGPVTETGVHFKTSLGMIKGWTWRKSRIPQLRPNADGIIPIELPLVRTRTIRGQLVSTQGEPLPGIELHVAHGNISEEVRSDGGTTSSAERNEEFQTDAEGRFLVEVIPGVINVSKAISPGSNISTALSWPEILPIVSGYGKLRIDEGESPLDLPPLPITVLSGQVVDEQMKPYPGMIFALGERPNRPKGIGYSGTDGMFRIEAIGEPSAFKVLSMENANQLPFRKQETETIVKSREPLVLQVNPSPMKELSSDGDKSISVDLEAPVSPAVPAAPTKSETTQPAPNIPQTRPSVRGAPTRAEPRPVVDLKRELLQRLVRGGKISSENLNAMITLVSSEGAYDWEFISVILYKFDESCEPKSTLSKQNLLAVLTKILEIHGTSRWQEHESGPDSIPQAVIPDKESLSRLTSEILEHLIDQGVTADRSDIDAFVMALRQAHHADGKEFLRLVLQHPEVNAPANQKPGLWADNMGGTWRDAKFHAAVALAELGEPEGVERLIEFARPNDFGLDESLFSLAHTRDASGSRRASSLFALIDLFGLEPDAGFAQMEAWWKVNQGQFHPKKVALGRAIPPRTREQAQP